MQTASPDLSSQSTTSKASDHGERQTAKVAEQARADRTLPRLIDITHQLC